MFVLMADAELQEIRLYGTGGDRYDNRRFKLPFMVADTYAGMKSYSNYQRAHDELTRMSSDDGALGDIEVIT